MLNFPGSPWNVDNETNSVRFEHITITYSIFVIEARKPESEGKHDKIDNL